MAVVLLLLATVCGEPSPPPAPSATPPAPAPAPTLIWAADGSWLAVGPHWWQPGGTIEALPEGVGEGQAVALDDGSILWLADDLSSRRWRPGTDVRSGAAPSGVPIHEQVVAVPLGEGRLHVWMRLPSESDAAEGCGLLDLDAAIWSEAVCYPHAFAEVTAAQRASDGRTAVTSSSEAAAITTVRFRPPDPTEAWDIPSLGLPPTVGARFTFEQGGTLAVLSDIPCDLRDAAGWHACVRRLEGDRWVPVTERVCQRAAWSATRRLACWYEGDLCVTSVEDPDACVVVSAPP